MASLSPDRLPHDPSKFDTRYLLEAVAQLDRIQTLVVDRDDLGLSKARDCLHTLHRLVSAVMNERQTVDEAQVWELIDQIESVVFPLTEAADRIMDILHTLANALPESNGE
jgi:hypothetical protein